MQPDTAPATNHLPPGWRVVRFGDVVREVKVKVDPEESGLERYVAGEHMVTDDLHIRSWGTIGDGYLGPAFHRKFVTGQVLYGSRRTYLRKVAVAEFDGVCANTTFVLEPANDDLLPELLPFIMQTEPFTRHSIGQSRGSTNPYITWKDLAWYEFPLPPRAEQQRIAELLWAADAAVEGYITAQEELNKSGVLLFEHYIARYERKDGKSFLAKLEDAITCIVAGKSPACASEPANAGTYGVLKVSAVGAYDYIEEENKELLDQKRFVPELEVQPGFLLVTRANALKSGVGRACIVYQTRPGLMLSDKTLRLVVDEKKTSLRFLLQALRSKGCRRYIESVANGTEAKNISQSKLKKAPIPLPERRVQEEIEQFLYQHDQSLAIIRDHIENLRSLKRGLLTHLLCCEELIYVQ
jgi:type I restriction enzyme S subunit